ncbi:MAG: tetratricopeptide repeat protein [Ignavibacteriales bacterium]|nr:tetratricopeptide repeat protein [Ignavibacteriales bacterium]
MIWKVYVTVPLKSVINNRFKYQFALKSVIHYLFLSLLVLLFTCCISHAQWIEDRAIDQRVQHGIDELYNFEFDKADSNFSEVIKLRPDHPVGYFFRAMVQWERIISKFDDEAQDEKLYELLDVVVDLCEKRLDDNPEDVAAMFFKGGAIGFRGRLRANRGKWLGAANDGIVALPLVRKAYELEPNNYDVLLGIGIYNYYAAVIPGKYPFVQPAMIFFPSGDRKKGLEQLRQASLHAKYAQVEATYFLMQNYFTYEKDYVNALELARKLHEKYPNNSMFYRYLGRSLVSTGYLGEANDIFIDIIHRCTQQQVGYDMYDAREAHYYIGKFEFLAGRFDTALKNLYACDELSRKLDKDGASGFMSLANLIVGMIYDAQGKRQYAIQQYNKVLVMKEYENSYQEAKKYIQQPYKRN